MKLKLDSRQGDVCIFEVLSGNIPPTIKNAQCENAILAYGEASGHAHQFEDLASVDVQEISEGKYKGLHIIRTKTEAKLVHGRARDFIGTETDHDYHQPVTLEPDKLYLTGIVVETDWLGKTMRRVID